MPCASSTPSTGAAVAELAFLVEGAAPVEHSASPAVALNVAISAPGMHVESILLRSSVRIEAGRRSHDGVERERLGELFGGEELWSRAPKSLLWAQTTTLVPGFSGDTRVEVILPCSYDLAASAFRYLHGLVGGDVPLAVQFSGTVFLRKPAGLEVSPIPWDREAAFSLPIAFFERAIDAHFPGEA